MAEQNRSYDLVVDSPLGGLGIRLNPAGAVAGLDFLFERHASLPPRGARARALVEALGRYFDRPSAALEIPVAVQGTAHQSRVWSALRDIPAGVTRSYGELARELGSAPRAVGQACRRNPVPLLIPCHRVVQRHAVGGFAGQQAGPFTEVKRWLLAHEAGQHPTALV